MCGSREKQGRQVAICFHRNTGMDPTRGATGPLRSNGFSKAVRVAPVKYNETTKKKRRKVLDSPPGGIFWIRVKNVMDIKHNPVLILLDRNRLENLINCETALPWKQCCLSLLQVVKKFYTTPNLE